MQKIYDEVASFLSSTTEQELKINGPAGSGKTYLLNELIKQHIIPMSTSFTATTNKAANVVANVINIDTVTVYSLLRLIPFDNYNTGRTELKQTAIPQLDCTLIVIDEGYMLTDAVIKYLETATQTYIKIIYIGDSYQLPPVFYDESPLIHREMRTITLSKIWRTNVPEIQEISNRFREAVDTLKFGKLESIGTNVQVVNAMDFMNETINSFKSDPDATKILGWTNAKTIAYNNFVNKLLNHKEKLNTGDRVVINTPIEVNNKIVFSVDSEATIVNIHRGNNKHMGIAFHEVNLSNAAIAHIAVNPADLQKELTKYKKLKDWKNFFELKNFFNDVRHTYACTVHKSQGSTYGTVFIDVHDIVKNRNIKEVARLLYVAVSRASDRVILCIDTSSMEQEVQMLNLLKIH